jgi:hypothetical protein
MTTSIDNPHVQSFLAATRRFYCPDFDGVSAEYGVPDDVDTTPGMRQAQRDVRESGIFSGTLTGRPVLDVVERMAEQDLYAGNHGTHLWVPRESHLWVPSQREQWVPSEGYTWRDAEFFRLRPVIRSLYAEWAPLLRDEGLVPQDQDSIFTAHWGERPFAEVAGTISSLETAARRLGLKTDRLSGCLDVRSGSTHKGHGLRKIVTEFGVEALLFAGDDFKSDAPAFIEARQMVEEGLLHAAVTVAVVHPTRKEENGSLWAMADIQVEGVEGFQRFTQELAQAARS